MNVTGIGPNIKKGTTWIFISGTGFSEGDDVTLEVTVRGGATSHRSGTVIDLVEGGCIAKIGPKADAKDIVDGDLADVTVTVSNGNESDSSTEPGIEE